MAIANPGTGWWTRGLDLPTRTLRNRSTSDYELYEEDGEFVLTVQLPGFDAEEIDVAWDDGVLNVAADHADEDRGRRRTYHRRFRFPKRVNDAAIEAEYRNGILEVTLPVQEGVTTSGTPIEVQA